MLLAPHPPFPFPSLLQCIGENWRQKTAITGCDKKIYWTHWDKKTNSNSNNTNNKTVWKRECGAWPSCCCSTRTSATPLLCLPRLFDWKEPFPLEVEIPFSAAPGNDVRWCRITPGVEPHLLPPTANINLVLADTTTRVQLTSLTCINRAVAEICLFFFFTCMNLLLVYFGFCSTDHFFVKLDYDETQ